MQELENRIAAAGLPAEAQKVAERELKRLKRINPMQAEHTVIRSVGVLELPDRQTLDVSPDSLFLHAVP